MKIYPINELIQFAFDHSPFYRDLYTGIKILELSQLPVVPQSEFWQQNSWKNNRVLTAPPEGGIIFKSGGTTGEPKFSLFTQEEWESFTEAFGEGLASGGMKNGERVANLFYVGDLYASFLFIMKSMENSAVSPLHFPLSGALEPESALKTIRDYQIETLVGVPTTLLQLASTLQEKNERYSGIKRILFGGESMYLDQRAEMLEAFPSAVIQSIGYASVDAGLLGYATPSDAPEVHRTFGQHTIVEILDPETHEVIEEVGRIGLVVVTNLTRRLMPIIRYPAGDLAEWLDPPGTRDRRFLLRGRSEEGARVGPTTLYYEDVHAIFSAFKEKLGPVTFQLEVTHFDLKDELCLRFHSTHRLAPASEDELIGALFAARPMLQEMVREGKAHPPRLEWVERHDLLTNHRTGKLRRIIDNRSR